MTKKKDTAGRIQLFLIALVFFGPLILAAWLYFSGSGFQPVGKSNNGELLEPLINIGEVLPGSAIRDFDGGHWLLVYSNTGACGETCETALYTLRQSRLMLGEDMDRLVRVFLHGDTTPDTVFIAEEHKGLITLRDADLSDLLMNKKPEDIPAGGYYLIDPLGNLVMYFRPDIEPTDMVEDLEHLLELSRIG